VKRIEVDQPPGWLFNGGCPAQMFPLYELPVNTDSLLTLDD
jgi:hypothetical protein